MGYFGLLDLGVWQTLLVLFVFTQITIVSITLYLHRHSAHNGLALHPVLAHFFRFWLWLTTAIVTKEWTAIHRKHHAACETAEDPHSPVVRGLGKVLLQGSELYQAAATPETLARYGKRTPQDWVETHVYGHRYGRSMGITLMAIIDLLLFGVNGIWMWAIQMAWSPIWAAGVINGIGHAIGYRNFECADNSRNIFPWGLFIGGEELHNNHHAYPHSPKMSRRWWELDIGWGWIRLFQLAGLATPKGYKPLGSPVPGKREVDVETLQAITNNRFEILRQYRKRVLEPMLRQQQAEGQKLFRRARKLLSRDASLIKPQEQNRLENLLEQNPLIKQIYDKSHELQTLWQSRPDWRAQDKLNALIDWCHQAEASGIRYLEEFAATLRSYALTPALAR